MFVYISPFQKVEQLVFHKSRQCEAMVCTEWI